MRWLFLGLIIINVFYFLWSQQGFSGGVVESKSSAVKIQEQAGKVQLLSETSNLEKLSTNTEDKSVQREVMLLGSFSDVDAAQKLQQRLLSLDIKSAVAVLDNTVAVEYLLYLQPLASRQASMRLLKELHALQFDGYLITEGRLSNAISLGVFARNDLADEVSGRLRAMGYQPTIKVMERVRSQYWVAIDVSARHLLSNRLLEQLVDDFPDLKHQLLPSDKVKSEENK